ncbi:MAG: dTDP-glucose 4,6-dehydratase [Muribaculaceae bacterium]|nr:dTDP-glucose 4,6-dehydratase [Muribaculaceae bacterium]
MTANFQPKNILVTGGAGFIGSNFVKYLCKHFPSSVNIIILDALTYAANLATLKVELKLPNVTFIKGNINDEERVASIFKDYDIDWVVNFAAESHVDRSILNPRLFLETNVLGTQTLLNAAKSAWQTGIREYLPNKRFLQVSTDEVYGSLAKEWCDAKELQVDDRINDIIKNRSSQPVAFGESFFVESTPLAPRSPYSASKASADMLVMAYFDTYGLPVNITRCSNNYGPCQFPEKLIPLVINNILEGRKIPVYGKGENVRDWLYVEDHVKAILAVLEKGVVGEVYNVGGFNEESNINIVKTIISLVADFVNENPEYKSLLKEGNQTISEELITFVADRPGHDMRYAINPEKIATELGWYPETCFKDGIRATVKWYLDNRDWVETVISGDYRNYYESMYNNR